MTRFAQCGNGQHADMRLTSCASSDGYMMRNGKKEYSMACLNTNVLSAAKRSIREGLLPVRSADTFVCGRTTVLCTVQDAMQTGVVVCAMIIVGRGWKKEGVTDV